MNEPCSLVPCRYRASISLHQVSVSSDLPCNEFAGHLRSIKCHGQDAGCRESRITNTEIRGYWQPLQHRARSTTGLVLVLDAVGVLHSLLTVPVEKIHFLLLLSLNECLTLVLRCECTSSHLHTLALSLWIWRSPTPIFPLSPTYFP